MVQNKLHWAITGHTAAEIITERTDATRPNMGLTSWKGARGPAAGPIVAKNHLLAEEIGELNQRAILEHGGEISMEEPKRLALEQYQAFCQSRIEEDDALAGKEFEHKRMLPEWRAEVAEK